MAVDTFIGSIKMLGFNFVMRNYAYCDGTLLPVSTNAALYSLLGTMYGGDGRSSFGLPDLRGRVPIHRTNDFHVYGVYTQGARAGVPDVTLTQAEMPLHTHSWQTSKNTTTTGNPDNRALAKEPLYANDPTEQPLPLYSETIANEGGGEDHNNMMPYLGINFSIALQGLYPTRT